MVGYLSGKSDNSIDGRYTKQNFNAPNGRTDPLSSCQRKHFIEIADTLSGRTMSKQNPLTSL